MRGYDAKKEGGKRANIEDVCRSMERYTTMSEYEVKGYEDAHDMQLLIDEVQSGQDVLKTIDIEESAKLLYKY